VNPTGAPAVGFCAAGAPADALAEEIGSDLSPDATSGRHRLRNGPAARSHIWCRTVSRHAGRLTIATNGEPIAFGSEKLLD